MSSNFFAKKKRVPPPSAERVAKQMLTEDQLGENIRDACAQLGWHFLWLRKTINSSDGILDLMLIHVNENCPIPGYGRVRPSRVTLNGHKDILPTILHRELKGHDARGRLGKPTDAQLETIRFIRAAGGDADIWIPADWFSGKILEELR